LGAAYYTDHPLVPLYRTVANINIDGLAHFDTFNDVIGIGAEYSTLQEIIAGVAERMGLRFSLLPPEFSAGQSFARSDQIAFARAGIPSVLLMEGFDYRHYSRETAIRIFQQWVETRYHSPFDDLQQPLNLRASVQHLKVIKLLAESLASGSQKPEWLPGTVYLNKRLQTTAEKE
ncbi:MAG: M28 family peptidase, partial [Calditrichia bacterium]